jgi:hypothetical protein
MDSKTILEDVQKVFGDHLSKIDEKTPIDLMTIVTYVMTHTSKMVDLGGLQKKEVAVQVVTNLLKATVPIAISSNPLFATAVLLLIPEIVDKIYWASLQGSNYFNNKGCCGCIN